NPPYVGFWSDVYVHEAQIVTYTSGTYAGKQIAFCCGGANSGHLNTGVYIIDVTNKAAPVQLSYTTYPNARFCHQSWLSNDSTRIYINDELDENASVPFTTTIVMNVANLSAPFVEAIFNNGNTAIGHNVYISGHKLFAANYRAGLRVYDLQASPLAPPEVARFDTWPEDDGPSYNGLWNVWPFFPSGTIIGSDINRGLWVWRLGTSPGTFSYPQGLPALVSPNGAPVTIQVVPVVGETFPSDGVKMRVTVGGNSTLVPMDPIGGNLYRGMFPAIACTTSFTYGFEIHSGGNVFNDPAGLHTATSAMAQQLAVNDTCEALGGWLLSATGDNATAGLWVNADPVATAAQPEDDHTVLGTRCFITGNGTAGGAIGAADVDGGTTTLTSPVFAALGDEAYITYWRWYSNNQGNAPGLDSMPVSISNNGGTTWVQLELVTENAGAWVQKTFRVGDFVTPTATMRLRFQARDLDAGSIVEAGVDDVQVFTYDCTPASTGDFNGDGIVNGADLGVLLAGWGLSGTTDLNGDG
ncbi:MAG: choice-of-anchor B family protein, partial [Phycisphaerae bacterium]|nr:choice-of-anchor B family protein [Phycisphaerae bacterium]